MSRYVYRSAKTGKFVTRLYALLHPFSTVKELVPDEPTDEAVHDG